MGGINHRLSRSGQRPQRRQCQPSVTSGSFSKSAPSAVAMAVPILIHHAGVVDTERRITGVCGLVRYCDLGSTAASDSSAKTHECPRCRSGSCRMPLPTTHSHRPHHRQFHVAVEQEQRGQQNACTVIFDQRYPRLRRGARQHQGTHPPNQTRLPHLPVPPRRSDRTPRDHCRSRRLSRCTGP